MSLIKAYKLITIMKGLKSSTDWAYQEVRVLYCRE
jgi:hypothetical protein